MSNLKKQVTNVNYLQDSCESQAIDQWDKDKFYTSQYT